MSFLNRKSGSYKEAFRGPAGEFLLASLMDFTGFYKQSFSTDPYQTAFNEGKRAIGLHIIQMLALTEEDVRNLVRGYREELQQQTNNQMGINQ